MGKFLNSCLNIPDLTWRVGDLTLFEALTSGAYCQHSGEFDQNFSKSQMPGDLPGGGGMGGFGIDWYISLQGLPWCMT